MRYTIPGAVVVAMVALGCLDTALAQNAFVITGVGSNNTLTFCGPNAMSQQIMFATNSGNASYTIGITGSFVQVFGTLSGTATPTPQTLFVGINPSTAPSAPGTYPGSLTFMAAGYTTAVVNINLVIGSSTCSSGTGGVGNGLTASVSSLVFSGTGIQGLSVTNTSGQNATIFASASSNSQVSFLSVSPTSTANVAAGSLVTYSVTVSTTNLVINNTYTGAVNFSTSLGGSLSIPVTLNYGTTGGGGGGILSVPANQTSLTATLALGTGPTAQIVNVTNNSGAPVLVGASATTSTGQQWLTVSPSSQNISAQASVGYTVTINPTVLGGIANVYSGSVTFSGGGANLVIPVTLNYGTTGGGGPGGNGVLVVNPASISLTLAFGTGSSVQSLSVFNNSANADTVNVSTSTSTGQNWLSVSPSGAQVIGAGVTVLFSVIINPSALSIGTYSGTVIISDVSGSNGTINIPVSLCYATTGCTSGGSSSLTATPNPLNFSTTIGSTTVLNQNLTVTSLIGQTTINATAATATGANWLTVFPSFTQTTPSNTSVSLTVSVTPSLVPAGGSTGSISLTAASGTPLVVPVNVTFGATPNLTITPSQLSFAYQTGTAFPQPQNLTLSSASATAFTVSATTTTGGSWLIVSPQSGATSGGGVGTTVTVSINPSGLTANTYTGQITVSNLTGGTTQNIPVTLLVSNLPLLSFSNSGTTFNYQFQSTTIPTQQTVQVASSGNPLGFSASVTSISGGNFLTVTPANGTTPQTLSLSLNASALATLAPGTYTANVVVVAPGAGSSPVTYPVTLTVTNNVLLNVSQTSLSFNYQIGQTQPTAQTINITSSGAPLNYTVTASSNSTSCPNFLSVSPSTGSTNGSIAVAVNTAGLTAGTCTGQISISSSSAGNSPLVIPVNLYVSSSALLNVSPSVINLSTQAGTNPQNLTIPLTSTDPNNQLTFNVAIAPNSNFLLVGPTSGSTPTNLTVGFNTSSLPVGTYTSSVNISATGPSGATVANSPVTVPITVVVTTGVTASTTPTSLAFTQSFGGTAPPSQTLQVNTTTAGLTFSATSTTFNGGGWLSVTTTNNVTPGSITVSANGANLGTGTYSGVVTIVFGQGAVANTPLNVPVTLTVGPAQSLTVGPSSLTFGPYQAGATTIPSSQTVQVTSTGGAVAFTATAAVPTGTPGFVTVSPTGATTPATLTVALNAAIVPTLAQGTYTATITVSSPPLANQLIAVSFTVLPTPAPSINSVVNAASLQPGSVSPGEIITIFGSNMGPTTGLGLTLTPSGTVATSLGNTQVFFDNIASPLVFVRADQINAIVPYEISGRLTTNVVVSRNGVNSTSLQQRVSDTSPAIFSLNATSTGGGNGNGQGAIINQNGVINGFATPAAKGSVISIYATGEGVLIPGAATGSVTPGQLPVPKPAGNVTVTIGGIPAVFQFVGEAPGFVSGVLQLNVFIPAGVGSGSQQVALSVGNASNNSQLITVAVQ